VTGISPQRLTRDRPAGWPPLLAGSVIIAAAILAYSGTFAVPLIFDDASSIATNPSLRHLGEAFWPPINRTVTGRPVLNVSLALNYALGGTSVWGYHAANLAIHILAGLTLFGIIRRTLARRECPAAAGIAFSTALLWTVHPLGTAAVTYLAQRAESLMGLFYLLTLYGFVRGVDARERHGTPWFGLSFTACLLGMATKEVMASAPLFVLLYDRTFAAGSFREALRIRWKVHAALAATWLLLAFLVISTHYRNEAAGSGTGPSWWPYAVTQLPAIAHYLKLCLWPHPLVFDYGTHLEAFSARVIPSALLVVGLAAATLWALVRRPALGFLGASFFAILAPSSSIVPIAGETMAEFRMYLPLIPVAVLVVAVIYRQTGKAALPICLVLGLVLGLAAHARNQDYSSELRIWSDTVAKLPGNYRARSNLGALLLGQPGRTGDAVVQFEEALRLKPDSATEHVDLGNALSNLPGRLEDAIAQYDEAVRLDPHLYGAFIGLGNALSGVAGKLDQAITQYESALRLKPDSAEGHFDLGNALSRVPGRLDDAVSQYEQALQWRPDFAEAHFGLAVALLNLHGRNAEAEEHLEAGLRIHPDDDQARRILESVRAGGP
jgi:tetratricopeptide (TPR) repeat protein